MAFFLRYPLGKLALIDAIDGDRDVPAWYPPLTGSTAQGCFLMRFLDLAILITPTHLYGRASLSHRPPRLPNRQGRREASGKSRTVQVLLKRVVILLNDKTRK